MGTDWVNVIAVALAIIAVLLLLIALAPLLKRPR